MRVLPLTVLLVAVACSTGDGADDIATPEPVETTTATTPATPATTTTTTTTAVSITTTTIAASGQYHFPVQPPSAASYSRSHAGYPATDIFAACGTRLVAVTSGRVHEVSRVDEWDPQTDDPALRSGLAVAIAGDDGVRYYTSHLQEVAPELEVGKRVSDGQAIGKVGRTGNARKTPCHVHFGLSPPRGPGDWEVRRGVVWPWPYLDAWRRGEDRSPAQEVTAWASANR